MNIDPRDNTEAIKLENARAQNILQNADSFPDGGVENDNGKRREASPSEKERMDRDLEKLGDIFAGTSARWQLDGALNISLMKAEYIGAHKDFDLTLEPNDLEILEGHLFSKGYGLFLSMEDPNDQTKKTMKWVSADEFKKSTDGHLVLAAIDESGNIKKQESLSFIDVHLTKRDEKGIPLGFMGEKLPEQWYEPQWINFHERSIALSPPAKVAYFKLFSGRAVDQDDLNKLKDIGRLSENDLAQIKNAVSEGFNNRERRSGDVIDRISSQIKSGMTAEEISTIIASDPALAGQTSADRSKRINILASAITKLEIITPETIKQSANEALGFNEEADRITNLIKTLKQD